MIYSISVESLIELNHISSDKDELYDNIIDNHLDGLNKCNQLCLYAFNEAYGADGSDYNQLYSAIFPTLINIINNLDNLNKTLLVIGNHTMLRAYKVNFMPQTKVVCIDPFRVYTHFQNNHNLDYKHIPIDKLTHNKKYLCKFGKVNLRVHSYVLLTLLRDKNLLDHNAGYWSFVYENSSSWHKIFNNTYKKIDLKQFPGTPKLSNQEFEEISSKLYDLPFGHKCNLYGNFFYTGFPFDIKYHQDTEFSIVRETTVHNSSGVFPTEKTWIPISIKHPILLLGQPSLADYLERSGYLAPDNFYLTKNFVTAKTYQEVCEIFDISYQMIMNTSNDEMQHIADTNYKQFCSDVETDIQTLLDLGVMMDSNTGDIVNALTILLRNHLSNNANRPGKPDNTNFDYDTINTLYPDK